MIFAVCDRLAFGGFQTAIQTGAGSPAGRHVDRPTPAPAGTQAGRILFEKLLGATLRPPAILRVFSIISALFNMH